jgi:hypothetical protein
LGAALSAELAAAMPGTNPERADSKLQALVRTLVDSAIAGNARAQAIIVAVLTRMGDTEENAAAGLTADDREILDAYVGSELERRGTESDGEVRLEVLRPRCAASEQFCNAVASGVGRLRRRVPAG